MVTISILVFLATFIPFAIWRNRKAGFGSLGGWIILSVMFSMLGVISILFNVDSVTNKGIHTYIETVNHEKFYCERPLFGYDASSAWPGWVVQRYNYDESDAVCYHIDDEPAR